MRAPPLNTRWRANRMLRGIEWSCFLLRVSVTRLRAPINASGGKKLVRKMKEKAFAASVDSKSRALRERCGAVAVLSYHLRKCRDRLGLHRSALFAEELCDFG